MKPLAASLLSFSLLSGCAMVGPDHRPPQTATPTAWFQLGAGNTMVHAGEVGDLTRWWRIFDDPVLSGLVDEALAASPDVRSAQARLREARARRSVAAAALYPEVGASLDARRSRSSEETGSGATRNVFSAGLDASWELDVFGGRRHGLEAAEAELAASAASLDDTRVTLAAEVALNYFELRALETRLDIARANLASQAETLQLTEWRAKAGLVSSQDVEQARANLENTRAQIPVLERNHAEAGHRLAILVGQAPGSLNARLAKAGGLPTLPAKVAVGIPADTLRQRPDVRAAERRLAAATARVGEAEAARYPGFALSGSIGLEALTFGALGSGSAGTYSLLAAVSAPLFNAGRLAAQVEIQDAAREQALIDYQRTVLTALGEVENALVALKRSRERETALADALAAARNAALLAKNRYSAGLIDFQSVLDSERSVLAIEDNLAGTRADGVAALVRLYKALGGGSQPPSEEARRGGLAAPAADAAKDSS